MLWSDYAKIASLISQIPGWTEDRPSEPEEWRAIARLASAIQKLSAEDAERVLLVYMIQHPDDSVALDEEGPPPWARPYLLTRVIFDLPDAELTDADRGRLGQHHVSILYFHQALAGSGEKPPMSLSLPVGSNSEGELFLTAGIVYRGILRTGNPEGAYQPHLEYRYFRQQYGFRDLAQYLGGDGPTWRDLLRERRLKQNPEMIGR